MNKNLYPWRDHNSFSLLRDGERFFSRIFHRIESAERFVLIEIYLISSSTVCDKLIQALALARQRGAEVYLLLDDYGSRNLSQYDRNALQAMGAKLCFYNRFHLKKPLRYLPRDHRKVIIIDGVTTYVGGLGINDSFLNPSIKDQWRESVVEIKGACCQDWLQAFCAAWQDNTDQNLTLNIALNDFSSMHQKGRVALSPVQGRREVRRNIINQLRGAKRRIWISTAYFVPSRKLRRLLRRAAKRGVDVRLILPGAHTDHPAVRHAGRRFYARLLHNHIKIYEYQPRFIHHKIVLIDDWVSMGSANMDRWNLRWNLEANQEIDNAAFAQQVALMLRQDITECQQITYENWCQRTRWGRLLEWFWGKIDYQLVKLTEFKKRHSRTK